MAIGLAYSMSGNFLCKNIFVIGITQLRKHMLTVDVNAVTDHFMEINQHQNFSLRKFITVNSRFIRTVLLLCMCFMIGACVLARVHKNKEYRTTHYTNCDK